MPLLMSRFDRVVKGGNVVTPGGTFTGDVGIQGEKITALGVDLDARNPAAAKTK